MRISTVQYQQSGINTILDRQTELVDIQQKLATGKKVNQASDDPVAATQILRFRQEIALTERYNVNAQTAETRLNMTEATLDSAATILHRVRELFVQAGNGSLSDQDREGIALELTERREELIGLANFQDANGEYLFAGFQSQTQPFVQDSSGNVTYYGDQGQRTLQIAPSVQLPISESGFSVFMDIKAGNGTFVTTATPTNLGTGRISLGEVLDPMALTGDDYTVTMVTNSAGELAYRVDGVNGGQILPPPPADPVLDAPEYVEGTEINFNGISFVVAGSPIDGDTFTVEPSGRQDIFTTIQKVVERLNVPNETQSQRALLESTLERGLAEMDSSLENVLNVQAKIGARMNVISNERIQNDTFLLLQKTALSETEDIDIVDAIAKLQAQRTALEASQSSYAQISQLSLFKYI